MTGEGAHVELAGTGLCDGPWPELLPDLRPVLVVPAAPGRSCDPRDGWSAQAPGGGPHPGWSAVLDGNRLTVHRPGQQPWYDGEVAVGREWRRAVRVHRVLLLVTGPFSGVTDFGAAAGAGRLFLLTVPVRLDGPS
ncbi:hypothetical protein ACFCX4_10870 [Kitasatospora sp. NPDC056327]|uniref:hypothetical protein n=1 Tax=Kitasatospora sp. NPDC056327 TaxID=3345785 RepID=UPI0035D8ED58